MPNAAASSTTANSETHGAPGPASIRPVSRPRSTIVAASASSTSCEVHHSTTSSRRRISACWASRVCSRTASSRVASLPGRGSCAVAVIAPIRPTSTDITEVLDMGLWTSVSQACLWTESGHRARG